MDELLTTLPPTFMAFLKQNSLDASIYDAAATLPRYVRCNFLYFSAPVMSALLRCSQSQTLATTAVRV